MRHCTVLLLSANVPISPPVVEIVQPVPEYSAESSSRFVVADGRGQWVELGRGRWVELGTAHFYVCSAAKGPGHVHAQIHID